MSRQARKVLNIETAPPSFNLSENYDWLTAYAEKETDDFMTFDKEQIEEMTEDCSQIAPNEMQILQTILNDIGEDDAVDYYLY